MENNKDTEIVETNVEKETTQKTYTVEDVNNSFNAGVKKAHTDLLKDEDYRQYQNWKKNNQNDSEKIKTLESNNANLTNEINLLKTTIQLKDSDVKPEFIEFVTSKIMSMVNENTDFGTALKNYKKEAPQYFGETVVTKVQSSPALVGGTQPQTTNDIMNSLLRSGRE